MPIVTAALASALLMQQLSPTPRFELSAPLPTVPGVMLDTYGTSVGVAHQMARARNLQGRILWVDATANLDRYNSQEKIAALVRQIKDSGFNTIVFDVKPISGHVVYPSALAPKLTEWRGRTMPADFDPLRHFVSEAKAHRITLFVSLNAFSEGHRMFLVGPGYERPAQQTVLYESRPELRAPNGQTYPLAPKVGQLQEGALSVFTSTEAIPKPSEHSFVVTLTKDGVVVDGFAEGGVGAGVPTIPRGGVAIFGVGKSTEFLRSNALPGWRMEFVAAPEFVPIAARPEQQIPLMMNPHDPRVRRYALDIVEELLTHYDVGGVIYDDRLRYGGMNADFSELTRREFEKAIGQRIQWPTDVFEWTYTPTLTRGLRPGRFYDQWMAWRAGTLKSFVTDVRKRVKQLRPRAQFGAYVGSWYGEYPRLGHNYADVGIDAGFWFLSPNYRETGTAPLFDFLITGAYYPTATIYDAMTKGVEIGNTVEAAGMLTNRLARSECWTYAGIMLSDFKGDPDGLVRALQAACGATQGVMVFDLSHDIEPMWPVFARAFAMPRTAPHDRPDVLREVHARKAALRRQGVLDPPIIIAAGSAGTGH